jgi:hypothetical protein
VSRSRAADSSLAAPSVASSKPSLPGSSGGGHSNRSPATRPISIAAVLVLGRASAPARASRASASATPASDRRASARRSSASALRSACRLASAQAAGPGRLLADLRDCGGEGVRRVGETLGLFLGRGDAAGKIGLTLGRFCGTHCPVCAFPGGRVGALLVGADRAGVSGGLGADFGERAAGRLGCGAQAPDLGFGDARFRQPGHLRLRLGKQLVGVGQIGLRLPGAFGEPRPAQLQPLDRDRGGVLLPGRIADQRAGLRFLAPGDVAGFGGGPKRSERGRASLPGSGEFGGSRREGALDRGKAVQPD